MYVADENRYSEMIYNRCGKSGLKLPAISLGLWHNFGDEKPIENARKMIHTAFDLGITHFDLANNYGPPPGTAEINFGRILREDMKRYRDEMVISTKAGYLMWPGPYGEFGSRKNLLASLDQSLQRMGVDYVDIFYSHRFDPETPLEETMGALATAVQQGKALYVGLSSYTAENTRKAVGILREMGVKCLVHMGRYSMFSRWVEEGLQDVLEEEAVGSIAFCPLAQGLLTPKYLNEVPQDSRAAGSSVFLNSDHITPELRNKLVNLNEVAKKRGQSLAQMALAWVLRGKKVTSALIGASRPEQIIENVATIKNLQFSAEELTLIDEILDREE